MRNEELLIKLNQIKKMFQTLFCSNVFPSEHFRNYSSIIVIVYLKHAYYLEHINVEIGK